LHFKYFELCKFYTGKQLIAVVRDLVFIDEPVIQQYPVFKGL